MKSDMHLGSAVGPATREQLELWAAEHDRIWNRKANIDYVVLMVVLLGVLGAAFVGMTGVLSGLTGFIGRGFGVHMWEGSKPNSLVIGAWLVSVAFCALLARSAWALVVHRLDRRRPMNPYRPIQVTPDDLQERNADYPVALAYLDAIRHQRRSIVPHDLDVLAMVRQQRQSD
ncbi:hypothetical protein [Burkholderia sp. HI2714]|uniref:hypothetical protein n=1 Tax=Burkholderia sp. HI2714 TaxID=2015359 RepID=UPI00211B5F28|nr:hypothetical protein [Burkholderia sp. HI2714]